MSRWPFAPESTQAPASVADVAANTAAIALKADLSYAMNDQTGTTYGFVLADNGKIVTGDNASDQTFTLPANGSIPIPVGACIPVVQKGAGRISIAITSDTLNNPGLIARTRAQWSTVFLIKLSSTVWTIAGDMG